MWKLQETKANTSLCKVQVACLCTNCQLTRARSSLYNVHNIINNITCHKIKNKDAIYLFAFFNHSLVQQSKYYSLNRGSKQGFH